MDMGEVQATLFGWAGITDYPAARVDHRVSDGDVVRVGPLTFTAHVTPHAPTCTTWTFTVRDRDRDFNVVHRCRLEVPASLQRDDAAEYAARRGDFERSFAALRRLPVDIWLTPQGREYGRYRKYQASLSAEDPVTPFVDREGYLRAIDDAEARLKAALAD
jgi:metallo-beta-lactamase class B